MRREGQEWVWERAGWRRGSAPDSIPSPPGYRSSVTLVQKGCWGGPLTGQMLSNDKSLPPDYSVVRRCATDLCNVNLQSHDSLPNLSPGLREGGAGRGAGRAPGVRGRGLRRAPPPSALAVQPSRRAKGAPCARPTPGRRTVT